MSPAVGASTANGSCPRRTVCIVQPYAIGALDNRSKKPFGGAEVRAVTFARLLRDSGRYEPVLVVDHEGVKDNCQIEGIRIRVMPRRIPCRTRPLERLRCFYESLHADVFLAFGAHEISHEVGRYGGILGIPVVVGVAADASFAPSVYRNSAIPDGYGIPCLHAWYALAEASHVLVQTEYQLAELERRWEKKGSLIPNPLPWGWRPLPLDSNRAGGYLWVGRAQSDKDPWTLFHVAERIPEARFTMVLDGGSRALGLRTRLRVPQNVRILDRVDLEGMRRLLVDCDAIVNTSPREGFPNLFLQAALVGKPALALHVDPDGWCSRRGCGTTSQGDLEHFEEILRKGGGERGWLEKMGGVACADALSCHGHDRIRDAIVEILDREVESSRMFQRAGSLPSWETEFVWESASWEERLFQKARALKRILREVFLVGLRVDLPLGLQGIGDRIAGFLHRPPPRNPFHIRASGSAGN